MQIHERLTGDVPYGAETALAVVDDPYSPAGETTKIRVLRTVRDDPLAGLYSRGQIDDAQFAAGRQWQAYYDRAGIGLVVAMDPTKEPVDGRGATRADVTDNQIEAFRQLAFAGQKLGIQGHILVGMVLGQGIAIKEICRRRGEETERYWDYWGRRLRECLETLAEFWGFASVDKRK